MTSHVFISNHNSIICNIRLRFMFNLIVNVGIPFFTQMSHTKLEQPDVASVEQTTDQSKSTPQTPVTSSMEQSSYNIPSDSSSVPSKRSLSTRQSDGDKNSVVPVEQQQPHGAAHHHPHHYHHHLHPQMSDVSWDEDTSSTSGYRESYSMQIVSLDGINTNSAQAPPLASPDLNDMPSTSSTTTNNYIAFDGSSPDCSMNGSGGEKTALLTSSQRTTSQHSLLMVFPNQDEDTLI